jgi:hypothetical protein
MRDRPRNTSQPVTLGRQSTLCTLPQHSYGSATWASAALAGCIPALSPDAGHSRRAHPAGSGMHNDVAVARPARKPAGISALANDCQAPARAIGANHLPPRQPCCQPCPAWHTSGTATDTVPMPDESDATLSAARSALRPARARPVRCTMPFSSTMGSAPGGAGSPRRRR